MGEANDTISPEGMAKATAELEQLREVRRPEIVAAIKTAREFGDLKENAEYHAAREAQAMNEARIRFLEHHLATAEVVEPTGGDAASVGSQVSYRDSDSGEIARVTLVHRLEASLPDAKLSVDSPIGAALLGARQGQQVILKTPRGGKQLEILEVG